jgi:hypothetical protein
MTTNIMLATGWFGIPWSWYGWALAVALLFIVRSGFVLIRERQVGIVIKRFAGNSLPPGRLIALAARPVTRRTRSRRAAFRLLALAIPRHQSAGHGGAAGRDRAGAGRGWRGDSGRAHSGPKVVDCDNFQDARKFLLNGGEKGRQLGILTAGTYRINTRCSR